MEVTRGQVRAVRRMFKKFPLYFLNSLLAFSGCMGSGIVMMEQCPSISGDLDVFCQLRPEASTELHITIQNSHLHLASENRLRVQPYNPKTR
jgi:hypothetical protein